MSNVHFPAHKLCFANIEGSCILLAATGTCILSFSFPNGEQLSSWPRDNGEDSGSETENDDERNDRRPSKRQKLNTSANGELRRHDSEASEASIEIVAEGQKRQKGERRRPKIPDLSLPNVSHLILTSQGRYAIAITAEDKAVRVLSVSRRGKLRQISSRCMPKKCCAITLTADEKTILTADKFGDVYAIPLHPTADYQPNLQPPQPDDSYKPSASELTVHTKGNLDALRQQQMQKQRQSKKEGPIFEHKLLLGHVSLLTDLAIAQSMIKGTPRPFILTSDRDEHIRVSRGMPQTHVIHSFCLGHLEFVSKLCILPWDGRVLVAGNGEPTLRIYDWQDGQQRNQFDFLAQLRTDIEGAMSNTRTVDKLAVAGIWPISLQGSANVLLVALEGLPLLFSFHISEFDIHHVQTLKLDANVLDLIQCRSQDQDTLAVSVDTVHQSGSYRDYRKQDEQSVSSIQFFSLKPIEVVANEATISGLYLARSTSTMPWDIKTLLCDLTTGDASAIENGSKTKDYERAYTPIGEFVYGLENLRKRRGNAAEEEEDDDEAQGDNVG